MLGLFRRRVRNTYHDWAVLMPAVGRKPTFNNRA